MTRTAHPNGTADLSTTAIRVVAFDLDGTLAASKSRMGREMADLLAALLDEVHVLIISGGAWPQFESQVLTELRLDTERIERLHLMPTCGTSYMRWSTGSWATVYAHELPVDTRRRIVDVVEDVARDLGHWEPDAAVHGARIEDRGSQITFSALGQQAPLDAKHAWDAEGTKRRALRDAIAARLPDLEVRSGGSTSIDITEKGIDKAFGLAELMQRLGAAADEVLFVGDALQPGGNDHPVTRLGVATNAVDHPEETVHVIRRLLAA